MNGWLHEVRGFLGQKIDQLDTTNKITEISLDAYSTYVNKMAVGLDPGEEIMMSKTFYSGSESLHYSPNKKPRCFWGSIQEVMVSQYVNMIHQTLQSDLADVAGWMVVFFLLCYSVSFPLCTLRAKLRRTTSSDRTDCSLLSRI